MNSTLTDDSEPVLLHVVYANELRIHAVTLIWMGYQRLDGFSLATAEEDAITGSLIIAMKQVAQDPTSAELSEKRNGALPYARHSKTTAARGGLLELVDVPHEITEPAIKVLDQVQPVVAANLQSFENRRQVVGDHARLVVAYLATGPLQ